MKICSSNSYAVAQHQCTAALLRATCIPHCPVLLCKAGLQQTMCHCNYTCGDLLFIQGAVTQHKCTATLFRAKCNPHCSVLLCKTGSQHALCHCSYTCEDLLLKQVCSDSAPMHCSAAQGKMHSPLFNAALQNRLTAGNVSLQLHRWRFALHTGVQ